MDGSEALTDTEARRFIKAWVIAFILLGVAAGGFACVMDPYLMVGTPRIVGFNARKPAADTHQALMKAYDVFRTRPRAVILGSSRAALGLNALDGVWPQEHRPVYNLALPLGGPDVAYRYLQHAVTGGCPVSLVVLSLEFEYLINFTNPFKEELADHVVVESDGLERGDRAHVVLRDSLLATFSFGALRDSFATLSAYFRGDSSDLTAGNWARANQARADLVRVGPHSVFALEELYTFEWYFQKPLNPQVMSAVRAIVAFCRERHIRLIVILSPSHAEELEMFDRLGYSGAVEGWKRELVALTARSAQAQGDGGAEIWDFDDYNAYTTEPVPTDKQPMRWFVDPEHYSRELGEEMLKRIFGGGDPRLGARLSPQNIESHLGVIREHRRVYRQTHEHEVQLVRDIYEAALNAASH